MTSILLVDEDVDFADLVQEGLRRRGYEASSVHSAKEALAVLERRPVDILVAHVHLSDVSGLELVARLRDRGRVADLPEHVARLSAAGHDHRRPGRGGDRAADLE